MADKKESVRIETFENANGYTARIEGDAHSHVFGDVSHYRTAAEAARVCASYELGFTYHAGAKEIAAKHVGGGVYVCKRK